jgi:DNA-directed RNA polymerase subunit RPC12/RpoP
VTYPYLCMSCQRSHDLERSIEARDDPALCPACGGLALRDTQAQYRALQVRVPIGFHTNWSDILDPRAVGTAPHSEDRRRYAPDCGTKWV